MGSEMCIRDRAHSDPCASLQTTGVLVTTQSDNVTHVHHSPSAPGESGPPSDPPTTEDWSAHIAPIRARATRQSRATRSIDSASSYRCTTCARLGQQTAERPADRARTRERPMTTPRASGDCARGPSLPGSFLRSQTSIDQSETPAHNRAAAPRAKHPCATAATSSRI